MKTKRLNLFLLVGCFCALGSALGAGVKIGFVDVEQVFDRYQKTIDLKERLQQERLGKIEERKQLVEKINKLKDEAEALSGEAKSKKEAAIDENVRELYQFEEKVKREAINKQTKLQGEILNEIEKAIDAEGKKGGFTAIFTFAKDDIGYHAEKFDCTKNIIETLNTAYKKSK
jgi:Skp family chaperone for outer membrane proteins